MYVFSNFLWLYNCPVYWNWYCGLNVYARGFVKQTDISGLFNSHITSGIKLVASCNWHITSDLIFCKWKIPKQTNKQKHLLYKPLSLVIGLNPVMFLAFISFRESSMFYYQIRNITFCTSLHFL